MVPFICPTLPHLASARVIISKCFCGYQLLGWHNILGSLPWPQIVQCSSYRIFPLILPPWYLPWTLLMPLPSCPNILAESVQWIYATFPYERLDVWVEFGEGGQLERGIPLSGTSVCKNYSWALEKFPRWLGFFFFSVGGDHTTQHVGSWFCFRTRDWTHVPLLQEAGILTTKTLREIPG